MDFRLTDEQRLLQQTARKFAEEVIWPASAKNDEEARWPVEIMQKALELGLRNITVPEKYGGPGLGVFDYVIVNEQMSWGCVGSCVPAVINASFTDIILQGTEEQRRTYLGRMVAGEFGAYAVTEPGAGSDLTGIETRAVKRGNEYILNGAKIWITNAPYATFFVVLAKTDPRAGHRGLSLFLVEGDTPGLHVGRPISKLGQRAAHAAEVFFHDVAVPASALIGNEGDGFPFAMRGFDKSRPIVAANGLGLVQRCIDLSLAYARERKTFGKPIIEHQAVGHKLAEMRLRLEAARLMVYQAAWLADAGKHNTLEASCAKAYACDTAMFAATEAMQIYGGYGYSTEYPVEKLFRDAKVLQIYEGTSEIQRNIIVREMCKRKSFSTPL